MPGWLEQRLPPPSALPRPSSGRIWASGKDFPGGNSNEKNQCGFGIGLWVKLENFILQSQYLRKKQARRRQAGKRASKLSLLIKTESNYLPKRRSSKVDEQPRSWNETLIYFCGNLKQIALIPVPFRGLDSWEMEAPAKFVYQISLSSA